MCEIEKQIGQYQARLSRKDEKLNSIKHLVNAITNSMKLSPELKEMVEAIRYIYIYVERTRMTDLYKYKKGMMQITLLKFSAFYENQDNWELIKDMYQDILKDDNYWHFFLGR